MARPQASRPLRELREIAKGVTKQFPEPLQVPSPAVALLVIHLYMNIFKADKIEKQMRSEKLSVISCTCPSCFMFVRDVLTVGLIVQNKAQENVTARTRMRAAQNARSNHGQVLHDGDMTARTSMAGLQMMGQNITPIG